MSLIGKKPVEAKDVKVNISASEILVEGSKGKSTLPLLAGLKVEHKEDQLFVTATDNTKQTRSNHGTMRALLVNTVEGVTKGHSKDLEIQGVGFRGAVQGTKLVLNLGFSHQVEYEAPKEVKVSAPKPTEIKVEGIDKALVGQVAAKIRGLKPPEPYKGKGIRYVGEYVRRKQGKSVGK